MKGVDWGGLYAHLKNESLDPKALEDEVASLTIDDDVTRRRASTLICSPARKGT